MLFTNLIFLLTILLFGTYDIHGLETPDRNKVVVCYVASWATYRQSYGQFSVENLRPELCTHLVYSFAGLNTTSWIIRSTDEWTDTEKDGVGNYRKMTALRKQYPELKVTLGIGGWSEGGIGYSQLASSPERRKIFVDSTIEFLNKYEFDGLTFVWMYPGNNGATPEDKQNFVSLLKELHEAYQQPGLSLTVAISAMQGLIDLGYDVPRISEYVDHIHIMSFDYHGSWDQKVLPHAPLRAKDGTSVEDTVDYMIQLGAPAEKLVLALPMYGRTYILVTPPENPNVSPIGLPALPNGFKGPYTNQDGFMGYNEICEAQTENPEDWKIGWDDDSSTAYTMKSDHVIVYDDMKAIETKVRYVNEKNLAGVKIWSIDTDDFRGRCGAKYPLTQVVQDLLGKS